MADYGEELDAIVDLARDEIAAVRACTEAEYARLAEFQHGVRVSWVWPERDWRSDDLY